MNVMRLIPIGLFFLGMGCGFVSGTNEPWPLDSGITTGEASAPETNPVGEVCPTTNLGHKPHTRMPNLKFQGFKANGTNVVATQGDLTTISLCDWYNPTGKNGNYKLMHLTGAARWCGPCSVETSGISGWDGTRTGPGIAANLAPQGVVFVQGLFQAENHNAPATPDDLRIWMNGHQSNFASFIDPGPITLHEFTDGNVLPWNAEIDLRSMEILALSIGADSSLQDTLTKLVATVNGTPPLGN